jgi:hypothetical protein
VTKALARCLPAARAAAMIVLLVAGSAAAAPAPAKAPAKSPAKATAKRSLSAPLSSGPRRPLTLAAQTIEGRSEAPRVLFVHTGPKIALEDAPKHPSYLRDDFTAALASPVTVRVRMIEPLRAQPVSGTQGGSR